MIQNTNNQQVQQENSQKYLSHKLLFSISQKYPDHSFAQAINYNNTIMAYGSKFICKVIFFKNENFLNVLQVKKHQNVISTLTFFKDRSQLISGSYDSSIIIYPLNLLSSSKHLTKLKQHTHLITCLIVSKNSENFFISGSLDKNIKFWSFSSSSCWTCTQTISEHLDQVSGLSLNEDGRKLISCSRDKQIFIMERSTDQFWYIKQKISGNGYRISFITTDIFSFQPYDGTHLYLYSFDTITGQYIKSRELSISKGGQGCQYFFPQIYISSKQLLISKNGYFVNLIKFNFNSEGWDCKLEEEIEYNQLGNFGNIFGTISDNGEYFVTWDCKSGLLQVRKIIYENQNE
ncbi:unnamed protein product [Paramecium pentaurelia]|uniref:WD40-repeat-containing domain n=1 Tax=Paramecium pentaurelia TaxID=43138 RepID=A0A8S1XCD7_9CILI|nr:unnamed protein product [Paramecium pentaurelia]